MNILRGIGTALTSYGYGETERRREEALKAEREAQLRNAGRGMGGVASGTIKPGTPEFEEYVGNALVAGVSNPFAAVPEPATPETYSAPVAGVNARGQPVFMRPGSRGGQRTMTDFVPAPDETKTLPGPNAERMRVLHEQFGIWQRSANGTMVEIDTKIRPEHIAVLEQMWGKGTWSPEKPVPEFMNMNRNDRTNARFREVIESATRGFAGVPEPASREQLGPTAYGVPGGGGVAPGPGMAPAPVTAVGAAGVPSLEEQARQLRALGYSEEQIRLTLGTGR